MNKKIIVLKKMKIIQERIFNYGDYNLNFIYLKMYWMFENNFAITF